MSGGFTQGYRPETAEQFAERIAGKLARLQADHPDEAAKRHAQIVASLSPDERKDLARFEAAHR